jgi:hypothetical protein
MQALEERKVMSEFVGLQWLSQVQSKDPLAVPSTSWEHLLPYQQKVSSSQFIVEALPL